MARSKLSTHFHGMDNAVANTVNSEHVKVMAPGEQNPFTQCKVIARWHMTESQQDEMILKGVAGGRELYEFLKPKMDKRPWIYAVETWNEPLAMGLFDPAKRKLLVDATIEFLRLAHQAGWRVVWGNFSVGQPPKEAWQQFAKIVQKMAPGDMLGLHEYGWPRMDTELDAEHPGEGWWCLRYRKVAKWLAIEGVAMPRTIINECGIDGLLRQGSEKAPGGWMITNANKDLARQSYFDQLVWYDRELAKDDYIVAATPFTAAAGNPWETYNIDLPLAIMLHNHIASADFPAETGRARGFDASKYQANVNWDLVRREGFSFCILRASGPNQWPDYTGLEVDPALDSHWRGAGSIGLLRGAYHFLLPDVDGQAAFFAQALGRRLLDVELPLYADVEVGGTTEGKVQAFLQAADAWTGRRTGVYTNLALYKSLNMATWMRLPEQAGDRSLWLAQYGVTAPGVAGWEFWQYDVAAAGAVQGFSGRLDLNWYHGTAAQLRARYGEAAPEPPIVIEPEKPEEETMIEIDPRIAGLVTVTGAEPGALYRLARVGWKNEAESQGRHHIYIDVVDGEGKRLPGERVTMTWGGGSSVGVVEEKPGEPFGANFPMNASLGSYSAFAGTDPTASDRVSGLGLGTPEHPNTLIHTCFELVFVKGGGEIVPPVVPDPEPEPEPEPPEDVVDVVAKLRMARDLLEDVIGELEG